MLDDGAHGDGEAGDGVYGAEIPSYPAGSLVNYMFTYRTTVFVQQEPTVPDVVIEFDLPRDRVVINEFMASNSAAFQDGQSEFDDWIELLNVSTETVDLSGMYLTDSDDDRQQWSFPEGTTLDLEGLASISSYGRTMIRSMTRACTPTSGCPGAGKQSCWWIPRQTETS